MLRALFISLSESKSLRAIAERSAIGQRFSGRFVAGTQVEDVLRAFGVAEYRVEVRTVRSLPELRIQVEGPGGDGDGKALVHQLEAALNSAFSLRIPVDCVRAGELPRFEMKARRWVRM